MLYDASLPTRPSPQKIAGPNSAQRRRRALYKRLAPGFVAELKSEIRWKFACYTGFLLADPCDDPLVEALLTTCDVTAELAKFGLNGVYFPDLVRALEGICDELLRSGGVHQTSTIDP